MTIETVSVTIDGCGAVPHATTISRRPRRLACLSALLLPPVAAVAGSVPDCLVQVERCELVRVRHAGAEGKVVSVYSPDALKAREGVLEFLLSITPPTADLRPAGECELQDSGSRGSGTVAVHEYAKNATTGGRLRSDVLYVPNGASSALDACASWKRAETAGLAVAERGDRAFIALDQSERLDHAWRQRRRPLRRFADIEGLPAQARAWDLDKAA